MREEKFKEFHKIVISWMVEALESNTTLRQKAIEKELHDDFFYDYKRKTIKQCHLTNKLNSNELKEFESLYTSCLNIGRQPKTTAKCEEKPKYQEEESNIGEVREDGKIISYKYEFKDKFGVIKNGVLSREEMTKIYNLYSAEGANVTQRTASREFPQFSFFEFKKLLHFFCITKASLPIPIHDLEEKSEEENLNEINRIREIGLLKKIEEEKLKNNELKLRFLSKENSELRLKLDNTLSFIKSIDLSNIKPFEPKEKRSKKGDAVMLVYLADWHIGCYVDGDSLFENRYDESELWYRLTKLIQRIGDEATINGGFKKIVLCNLGDSLDGYNSQTTRGGHALQQNLNNKEQFNVFTKTVIKLIDSLYSMDVAGEIEYIATGDSNHDGDFGYVANKAIQMYLNARYPDMVVRVFEKFIEFFKVGSQDTFILCHGKDKEQMFKNFPLNLDEKTENYINGFLDYNNINTKNIHFIKADLHQSALNYGRRFRYRNIGSIFGSSKWIHLNFGNTKAAVDYDIVYPNTDIINQGRIVLN